MKELTSYNRERIEALNRISKVEEYLRRFYERDEQLGIYLSHCVGRILIKQAKSGQDWSSSLRSEEVRHICDWLRAAITNDEEWLKHVDELGRPRKLLKFPTISAITNEANKAMLKAAQKLATVKLVDGDEKLHAELEDGYYLVQLLTPAALDRESAQMQHCIGQGAYDNRLKDEKSLFLSLRDRHGKAHGTLEVMDDVLIQIQGKQNATLIRKYLDLLYPYIRKMKYQINIPAYQFGYVVDADGEWHDFDNLPDGLKIRDSLYLAGVQLKRLPKNLSVGAHCDLAYTGISEIPVGFKATSVDIEGLTLTKIGSGFHIDGDLTLKGQETEIELSGEMHVGGSLKLYQSNVKNLPTKMFIGGDLDIRDTPITKLPDNLRVNGALDARGSKLRKLGKNLYVGHFLDVSETRIKEIPPDLKVRGMLFIDKTPITRLTGDKTAEGLKFGGLNLAYTQVTELPENLTIDDDLNVRWSKLERLPNGLHVGTLDLRGTDFDVLPERLTVADTLDLSGCNIETLPDDLTVGRHLILAGASIKALPPHLSIRSTLDVRYTHLKALPEGLRVYEMIYIAETDIVDIPDSISDYTVIDNGDVVCPAFKYRKSSWGVRQLLPLENQPNLRRALWAISDFRASVNAPLIFSVIAF